MSTTQDPAPGVDFWAAIRVSDEESGQEQAAPPQPSQAPQPPKNGRSQSEPPAEDAAAWASMFTAPPTPQDAAPEPPAPEPPAAPAAAEKDGKGEKDGAAKEKPKAKPAAKAAPKTAPKTASKTAPKTAPRTAPKVAPATAQATAPKQAEQPEQPEQAGQSAQVEQAAPQPQPQRAAKAKAGAPRAARPSEPAPTDWSAAERLGRSLRSRIVIRPVDVVAGGHRDAWLETLKGYAGGDAVLAGRIHDVMSGWHLVGELWRDGGVDEVHIRGTRVTVCGRNGIRQVPGFPGLAAARRTIEAITAAQEETGAVVTGVGESVVVARRHITPGDAATLVAAGVIDDEQVAQVEEALRRVRTVTVTGPAAPAVMRAFASLIPAGSRIYEGPYAVLPAGCVAAPSPLCADYVIGVRPDAEAEEMAAAGQLGALIANPRTDIPATVRLTVSGRSASPEKISVAG